MSNDLMKNWVFWLLIAITAINVGGFLVGKVVINKITNQVIEKLQKEYSPSPYGPGLDPDKVPGTMQQNRAIYLELTPRNQPQSQSEDGPYSRISTFERPPATGTDLQDDAEWRRNWERERGFRD